MSASTRSARRFSSYHHNAAGCSTLLVADPPISYDQISARLGIPQGSIGPTRARALEQLRNTRAIRTLNTTD